MSPEQLGAPQRHSVRQKKRSPTDFDENWLCGHCVPRRISPWPPCILGPIEIVRFRDLHQNPKNKSWSSGHVPDMVCSPADMPCCTLPQELCSLGPRSLLVFRPSIAVARLPVVCPASAPCAPPLARALPAQRRSRCCANARPWRGGGGRRASPGASRGPRAEGVRRRGARPALGRDHQGARAPAAARGVLAATAPHAQIGSVELWGRPGVCVGGALEGTAADGGVSSRRRLRPARCLGAGIRSLFCGGRSWAVTARRAPNTSPESASQSSGMGWGQLRGRRKLRSRGHPEVRSARGVQGSDVCETAVPRIRSGPPASASSRTSAHRWRRVSEPSCEIPSRPGRVSKPELSAGDSPRLDVPPTERPPQMNPSSVFRLPGRSAAFFFLRLGLLVLACGASLWTTLLNIVNINAGSSFL